MNYYVIHFPYFLMRALWHVSSLFNIKSYSLLGWKVLWVMLAARAYVLYLLLCRLNKKAAFSNKCFFLYWQNYGNCTNRFKIAGHFNAIPHCNLYYSTVFFKEIIWNFTEQLSLNMNLKLSFFIILSNWIWNNIFTELLWVVSNFYQEI